MATPLLQKWSTALNCTQR